MIVLVELEHRGHRAFEERPVVGHDDCRPLSRCHEVLEPGQAFEVQVVGGLVEKKDVGRRECHCAERELRRLSARKDRGVPF